MQVRAGVWRKVAESADRWSRAYRVNNESAELAALWANGRHVGTSLPAWRKRSARLSRMTQILGARGRLRAVDSFLADLGTTFAARARQR
jgi:hypothetical protein